MDLQFKMHRDVPYGWPLAVVAAWRALRRRQQRRTARHIALVESLRV